MRTLTAQRERLAAEPVTEAGHRYVYTGETFGEHWGSLTSARRNDSLRDHGIVVKADKPMTGEPTYSIELADVLGMVESVYPDHITEVREKLRTAGFDADDPAAVLAAVDREPSPGV